ncbi:paraneoplastic antigen Ma1 homolog isoform X2 [Ascaphus truei]|uniref:paraneoplastic antigen Ma1 homolog isoform X2 n=1 Tax=Ascaphus truei TaxID=8439 RepID=UPI003F5A2833
MTLTYDKARTVTMSLLSRQRVRQWAIECLESPHHVVAIRHVPTKTSAYDVRLALSQFPGLGETRVLDQECEADPAWSTVLVTAARDFREDEGPEVIYLYGARPGGCPLIYPELTVKAEEPSSGSGHGTALMVTSLPAPRRPSGGGASSELACGRGLDSRSGGPAGKLVLAEALQQLADNLAQASQAHHYRKLNTFSGVLPTPPGEEDFEDWKDHTLQVLDEWSCSEAVKRQRIVECLRPPASHIVRMYRVEHVDATAQGMVEVLTLTYGTKVDEIELFAQFNALRQEEGEKMSAFIRRIQLALWTLISNKVIPPHAVDGYRLNQLLTGSLRDHPIAVMLWYSLPKGIPPSFEDLMSRVKKLEVRKRFHTLEKGLHSTE